MEELLPGTGVYVYQATPVTAKSKCGPQMTRVKNDNLVTYKQCPADGTKGARFLMHSFFFYKGTTNLWHNLSHKSCYFDTGEVRHADICPIVC